MNLDKDKIHLIYFEEHLEEWVETVDYAEYSRDEPRWGWRRYIKVEEFDNVKEAIERAAELLERVDYDFNVKFVGLFKGNELLYGPRYIESEVQEINQPQF